MSLVLGSFLIWTFFVNLDSHPQNHTISRKADEIYIYKCHVNQDSGCVILLPGLYVLEMC